MKRLTYDKGQHDLVAAQRVSMSELQLEIRRLSEKLTAATIKNEHWEIIVNAIANKIGAPAGGLSAITRVPDIYVALEEYRKLHDMMERPSRAATGERRIQLRP